MAKEVRKPARVKAAEKATDHEPSDQSTAANAERGPEAVAEEEAAEQRAENIAANAPKIPGFDAKHLAGQIGDALLDQYKHARHTKPWDQLEEFEQKRLIELCRSTGMEIVIGAATAIAGKGFKNAPLRLDKVTLDDEAKIALAGPLTDEALLLINHNRGKLVLLVFADAGEFAGEMLSKAEPNQRDMLADSGEPDGEEGLEEEHDRETGELPPKPPVAEPPATEPAPAARAS